MKTVCIDARMAGHSGIGTYIRNLLAHFKKGPFQIHVMTSRELIERYPELDAFKSVLFSSPIYSLQEQLKLPFLVPCCDLFWSPHFNIPLGRIKAKRRIATIHDVYPFVYGESSMMKKRIAKFVAKQAVKRSDLIFTDSEFSKEEIIQHMRAAPEKIKVIYPGVDQIRFFPGTQGVQSVKRKFHLPEQFVLCVGILSPRKNIDGLLHAFELIRREHSEVKLVLVGREMSWQGWKEILAKNQELAKQVLVLGEISEQDLPPLYRAATIAIHPSFYEGFGLPPLEAMASGCPAIVSRVASLPEVCGEASLYMDPDRVENIADVLSRLLQNQELREKLREQGLQRSRMFQWENTARQHAASMRALF